MVLKMHTRAYINLAQGSIFLVSHPKKSHALEIAGFISCGSIVKARPTGVSTSGCPTLSCQPPIIWEPLTPTTWLLL